MKNSSCTFFCSCEIKLQLYNFSAVVQNLCQDISTFTHHPAKVIPEPARSASFSFALSLRRPWTQLTPRLLPSKPLPWKYKNSYDQTCCLLLFILLRPDASALVIQPPSTSPDINWSPPSTTAQFNAPSKPHSPRTVFNTENHNTHRPSTPTIFPHQYPLPELSITTLPTPIPIHNTHHGQKPHGKASQRTTLRHPSRKDSSTYRFLHNATMNQTTTTTVQELSTRSS